ncbi:MAG: alpha/beta hydrolase [Planctomycetes bacterium]|nr:alpha/beta hydrolase [Planctomycetota bacterium]
MRHIIMIAVAACLAALVPAAARAGEAAPAAPGAAPGPQPVLLWPGGAPGAKGDSLEDKPRITPYLPAGDGPFACIVVCPGGGYGGRAKHEGEPIAQWLNALGVAGFVLDYRVKPYRHPIPLGDAQRAIRTVRARAAEWKVDAKRVGILGFSAGGHLAASATTIFDAGKPDAADPIDRQGCRPDAAILCYPVITFGEFRHNGSMVNLLGPDAEAKLREEMSLETRVTRETPPVFLWHTSDDAGVPVENSLLFAAALHKNKVAFALHVFPHGRHGLGLAADAAEVKQWPALAAEWLKGIGFAAK